MSFLVLLYLCAMIRHMGRPDAVDNYGRPRTERFRQMHPFVLFHNDKMGVDVGRLHASVKERQKRIHFHPRPVHAFPDQKLLQQAPLYAPCYVLHLRDGKHFGPDPKLQCLDDCLHPIDLARTYSLWDGREGRHAFRASETMQPKKYAVPFFIAMVAFPPSVAVKIMMAERTEHAPKNPVFRLLPVHTYLKIFKRYATL